MNMKMVIIFYPLYREIPLLRDPLLQEFTVTPDYKDKKIETEKTKTYNTPFLSLKRPDFKYVIFKIVEVSPRNPPAKQHSRFGPIPPNVGRIGCAA